jgi:Spy/CpxP family protein refolding chaperone
MVERLKLTDEQRKAFDGILLEHRAKLIDLRASLEKAELTLEPLMSDDSPNESKILAQIDKVAQARAELEKANAAFLLAIRAKLTPEQWKQMQAFRAERERVGWDGKERGPGLGGQGPGGWKPGGQGPGGQHHQAHPPAPSAAEPQAPPAPGTAPGEGAEK